MRNNYYYLCQTPQDQCGGSHRAMNHGLENIKKRAHGSPSEAFRCHRRYLLAQGFTQVGGRDFSPPGNEGPVLVLTKKSRYGGKLRPGKTGQGEGSGVPAKRSNPPNLKGNRGGIVY